VRDAVYKIIGRTVNGEAAAAINNH